MADYYLDENGKLTKKKKKQGTNYVMDDNGNITAETDEDNDTSLADSIPELKKWNESKEDDRKWFQKGAFEDGYQFGDVLKSIGSTVADAGLGVVKGALKLGEGITDLALYGASEVAGIFDDDAEKTVKGWATHNTIDAITKPLDDAVDKNSFLGNRMESAEEALGQVGGIILTGGLAGAAGLGTIGSTAITSTVMGASSMGSGIGEALNSGASDDEAWAYGALSGVIDTASEWLFGGLGKGINLLGFGKGLSSADDILAKTLSSKFKNEAVKKLVQIGVKAGAEGAEEVIAGVGSAFAKKLTYMKEEDIGQLLKDEELWDQFVVGAVTSGIAQSGYVPGMKNGSLRESIQNGTDFITGYTKNEQKVIDKEIENRIAEKEQDGRKLTSKEKTAIEEAVKADMERGYLSTDTIESVLGGDHYQAQQTYAKEAEALQAEIEQIETRLEGDVDAAEQQRLRERLKQARAELKEHTGRMGEFKTNTSKFVTDALKGERRGKGSMLVESYNERARRGQAFEADMDKYTTKEQAVIQKAIDSGILNNTNRTHDFVDMIAKISAEKGVLFDFTNNSKLKESGFAVEGKTVNGYVTKDGVTVNIDSAKSLNSVVGHEITHVLEGTELYSELQKAVLKYAEAKGELATRKRALAQLYKGIKDANIDAELTADLVGDYLFTDADFIKNISTEHRNVFQKIYDEVKYLIKVAKAGSKEARELERVKRAFDKAYREGGKATKDTKYSLAMVERVQPKSKAWKPGANTDDVRAAHPTLYAVDEDATTERNPTQVKGTIGSYRKIYNVLQSEGFDGTILDASSGLGYGTRAGIEEYGFDVEDIEPYPDSGYKPKYTDYSHLNKKYDVVISNAVLNVLPQDQRDALVIKMGELLNDGGRMFVNVRGKDVMNASGKIAIDESNMEYFIPRTAKTGSYQKGFTKGELVAYLQDALGDGYSVQSTNMFGAVSAVVTKDGGVKYSLTAEQQEYFKDSVVRDENGNLKVMYHGTSKGGHTVFDTYGSNYGLFGQGSYFTDNKGVAETYTKKGKGNAPQVYESYLNITNPMDMDAQADADAWSRAFPDASFPESGTNEEFYRAMEEYFHDEEYSKWEAAEEAMDGLMGMGYDGITHIGGGRVNADGVRHQVYIAFHPEQIKNIDNAKPTDNPDIRFSLSDSEGRQLSKEQGEYFKDSKMRDDNGALKVMYHGSQDAGFHEFDTLFSDDGTSFFFVDNPKVAKSYSGSDEVYTAQTLRTAEDFNRFFEEIGMDEYEVQEQMHGDHKWFVLYEDGTEIASNESPMILYDEFRDWTGVGTGSANYQVYLNLTNPLVVDGNGNNWDSVTRGFSQEVADRYNSLTAEEKEALIQLASWEEFGIFKDEIKDAYYAVKQGKKASDVLASAFEKLGGTEDANLFDMFSIASDGFSAESINQFAVKEMSTRDYAKKAKAEGYDGVIFKNIVDNGAYAFGMDRYTPSTVAIAFEPNQIKSVANSKPTGNADIRFSLSRNAELMQNAEDANSLGIDLSTARQQRQAIYEYMTKNAARLKLPEDIEGNTAIENSSYDITEENTTVCIRSMAADALCDAVAEELGRPLTVEDTLRISQDLMNYTDEPECVYCYVATDRKAYREFLGSYHKQMQSTIEAIRSGKNAEEVYQAFLDGRKDTKNMRARFSMWQQIANDGKMISAKDLASEKMMQNAMRDPELAAQVKDAREYAQNASWAKKRMGYQAYDGHILDWSPRRISDLNKHYGLRFYSFSDFSPAFVLENMQQMTDAAVRGLKGLAYTKVLDFVEIFAPTNININISVFGYDQNGTVAQDGMMGADWNGAQDLRNRFENVGITFVATNDTQIEWALNQDWIDVVIPYHLVRTGKAVAEHFGYTNYTSESGDTKGAKWQKGDKKTIYPAEHNNDKQTYLAALAEANLEPRFARWVNHPNYMKLVNETRRSAKDTPPMQAKFNEGAAIASLDRMAKRGGYFVPIGGDYANMREIAGDIANDIRGAKANSLSAEGEQFAPIGNYNVYGSDVALQKPSAKATETVAPVENAVDNTVAPVEEVAPVVEESPNAAIAEIAGQARRENMRGAYTQDDIAPVESEIAAAKEPDAPTEDIAPVKPYASEAIKPKPTKEPKMARATAEEQMRMAEDIAPTYETTSEKQVPGQRRMFAEGNTAEVLENEPQTAQKQSRIWTKFRNNFLDKQSVFEDLALKTHNRELMGKANYMLSSESRAQWMIGHGAQGVKSLNDIRSAVEKTGLTKQFSEYLYHVHNIDRMTLDVRFGTENKAVFGGSVTAEVSRAEVKKLEAQYPQFKSLANDVYAYNKHLRQQMVKSGVISQETADLWDKMYPHYVPIRRVGESGLGVFVPLDSRKTGVNAPIKRATGGSSDILPLFDTMAMRTEQTYKAIAKNRFGVELKNTLGTTVETTKASLDEIIEGVDTHEDLLQKGQNGANPTFTVFENGKRVKFEISEDMYDALRPTAEGLKSTIKPLSVASTIQRGVLTEYNPVFMLTNAVKDAQDILINSQHPAKTYAKLPAAFKELITKGKWYNEYMANGGEQNTYFDGKSNTFTKADKGIKKIVGMPLRAISAVNNFFERAPRLAEYIASREAGASAEVAMLDAARVTTNFQAGGDVTKWANRNGFTFLNASVQGFNQQVRNVREAKANGLKGWVQLATKVAIAGLPAMLLNNLLWDDDEEYEELSDYVKENYYVVAKYGDGKFVRIPKGRTMAVIQNAFEQINNARTGDDEVDLNSFLELVISNLAPNNPLDNNVIAPIKQVVENKTWYGEALVPQRLQDLPAAEQYDESTDEISKWLGEKLNVSPYKLNYLLNQYSGGVGDVVLPHLTPEAERGESSAFAPFADKFTTDSVMNNQNVSDFYDTMDTLTANAKSVHATDEDVLKYKYFNTVNADLSDLYKQKREVQSSNLSDAEKYAQMREIQEQINELAKSSLATYGQVNIDGKYATIGDEHFRWYEPGEGSTAEAGWQKITDKQLEKQKKVTSGLGISASDYWSNKEEYDYAYENPERYAVSQAVGSYDAWKTYSSALYDIKADIDEDGKSINGSRKEKVISWINEQDMDYGAKLVLFKSEYPADDTYNAEIVEYLNSREDITYEQMVTILKELGFKVNGNNVTWD